MCMQDSGSKGALRGAVNHLGASRRRYDEQTSSGPVSLEPKIRRVLAIPVPLIKLPCARLTTVQDNAY